MNAPSTRKGDDGPTDPRVRDLLEAITILDGARLETATHASATPSSILTSARLYLDRELRDHFTGGRTAEWSTNVRQY